MQVPDRTVVELHNQAAARRIDSMRLSAGAVIQDFDRPAAQAVQPYQLTLQRHKPFAHQQRMQATLLRDHPGCKLQELWNRAAGVDRRPSPR